MWPDEENPQPGDAGEPEEDTGELPPLLTPGDLLADRYRIHSVSQTSEGLVYRAEDLGRCAQCGSTDSTADDRYCRTCGAALDPRPFCTIRLVNRGTGAPRPAGTELLDLQGLLFMVIPDRTGLQVDETTQAMRLVAGLATDAGRVRQTDEDSLLALHLEAFHLGRAEMCQGLFAIADGIGGLAHGATASRLALQHMARHFGTAAMFPADDAPAPTSERLLADLAGAIQHANKLLYEQQRQPGQARTMGTTVTAAYVRGEIAAVANVGDSRTYRWHGGRLEQVTQDHSMIAGLVRAGLAKPEEVYTHPQKSLITRSLGDLPMVEVDTFLCQIAPGDRLVLCCDGVWEMVRDEELEAILREEPDPQRAATRMVARANDNGGEDNLSVIVVAVEAVEEAGNAT